MKIFIGHSSKDNALAERLVTWLRSKGFDETFLDFDTEGGLRPGDLWLEKLGEAHRLSKVFLFLITQNWLNSSWCRSEYQTAHLAGKHLIPLLLDSIDHRELPLEVTTRQMCNLGNNWEEGLSRLESVLEEIDDEPESTVNKEQDQQASTSSLSGPTTGTVSGRVSGGIAIGNITAEKVTVADKIDTVKN